MREHRSYCKPDGHPERQGKTTATPMHEHRSYSDDARPRCWATGHRMEPVAASLHEERNHAEK